jgi:adenylate cyclase
VRCVVDEGGMINKFAGDGALCVFGAPTEQPDHADRALRAGHALMRALGANRGDIGAAIGISSGQVVAGNVGAADRYEYTVIGDAVNETSRLCDEAKSVGSRILASERTVALAEGVGHRWPAADTVQLRGLTTPTKTYTIVT